MPNYRVFRLSPKHRESLLSFFDRAFVDNPKWSSCYCHCYYFDHTRGDWKSRTATENRGATSDLVSCGQMYGFVAEDDNQIIGWCNAGPREGYSALRDEPDPHDDKAATGVILCFLIDPRIAVRASRRRSSMQLAKAYAAMDMQ